jgi:signal peptidase II
MPTGSAVAPDAAARRGQLRWLALSAVIIALDQWTKALIVRLLRPAELRELLPVFDLVHAHNRGAAFSMLAGASGWQRWLFTALAVGVSGALIAWLARLPRGANLVAAALGCIVGGALGNLIDRLRLGYVIDFIQVHWGPHYFAAFNVADSAITIGAGFLLIDAWRSQRATQPGG